MPPRKTKAATAAAAAAAARATATPTPTGAVVLPPWLQCDVPITLPGLTLDETVVSATLAKATDVDMLLTKSVQRGDAKETALALVLHDLYTAANATAALTAAQTAPAPIVQTTSDGRSVVVPTTHLRDGWDYCVLILTITTTTSSCARTTRTTAFTTCGAQSIAFLPKPDNAIGLLEGVEAEPKLEVVVPRSKSKSASLPPQDTTIVHVYLTARGGSDKFLGGAFSNLGDGADLTVCFVSEKGLVKSAKHAAERPYESEAADPDDEKPDTFCVIERGTLEVYPHTTDPDTRFYLIVARTGYRPFVVADPFYLRAKLKRHRTSTKAREVTNMNLNDVDETIARIESNMRHEHARLVKLYARRAELLGTCSPQAASFAVPNASVTPDKFTTVPDRVDHDDLVEPHARGQGGDANTKRARVSSAAVASVATGATAAHALAAAASPSKILSWDHHPGLGNVNPNKPSEDSWIHVSSGFGRIASSASGDGALSPSFCDPSDPLAVPDDLDGDRFSFPNNSLTLPPSPPTRSPRPT